MGNLYTRIELFDLVGAGATLDYGDAPRLDVACFVDTGTTRTVISARLARQIRTVRTRDTANLHGRDWPVHFVALRLRHRGCSVRTIDVAVSDEIVDSAHIDEAEILVGQDLLQRDRVSLRFDERDRVRARETARR